LQLGLDNRNANNKIQCTRSTNSTANRTIKETKTYDILPNQYSLFAAEVTTMIFYYHVNRLLLITD